MDEPTTRRPQRAPVTAGRVLRLRRLLRAAMPAAQPMSAPAPESPAGPEGLGEAVHAAQAAGAAVDAGREILQADLRQLDAMLWEEGQVIELAMILFDVDEQEAADLPVDEIAGAVIPFVAASWSLTAGLADSGTT